MRRCLPLVACIIIVHGFLNAQPASFERITIENGLSQGMIFDVRQTRDGFLWAATKDGLNRYDGYNFRVFTNDPFDPYSLAENVVTALFEDSRGWLWVGTESKGVDVYDRHSGRFHHFPLNFRAVSNASSYDVFSITEGPDGSIFLLQRSNGVVRISIPADWGESLPAVPNLEQQAAIALFTNAQFQCCGDPANETPRAIDVQPNGDLLVYTSRGSYRLTIGSGQISPVSTANAAVAAGGPATDDHWFAHDWKLMRFHNGVSAIYPYPGSSPSSWVMVKPDGGDGFWIAVNKHLWHLEPGEMPDFANPDWVLDENVSSITTDRNGNIWVGMLGYGMRKLNPRKRAFRTGATGNSIWGLWRDTRGNYYCKVVNQLYPFDPVTGIVGRERAFAGTSTRIFDVHIEPSGIIWLLGRGEAENNTGDLWQYDPVAGTYRRYGFDYFPYVYARLVRSRGGQFLITGLNCQLVRFDPRTAAFDYFSYKSLFGEKANTVRAMAMAEDGNGTLWIGTQLGLVRAMPTDTGYTFKLWQANPADRAGLNSNSIACLLPDPSAPGRYLWIGTKGGGINRFDLEAGRIEHLTIAEGLPDQVIYGILPGNEDPARGPVSLWCSTNRGLIKLVPRAGTPIAADITTFTATKGLQDNEFNTQAFYKAANGELLFGGVNGLNHFFPEAVRSDTLPPPVFIVGLEINHQPVYYGRPGSPLAAPVEYLDALELRYGQNNVSFEFAVLDFTDPAQNRYRYRLEGLDADWVETGGSRFAHFTHLAPGRYVFRVQGSNGEGDWREADRRVVVVVHPPWYRSNLAYLVYCLTFIGIAWRGYRFQLRRWQEREQLAFEQRETERVKAMEQTKTNFFNNITHEFRTPLTLIIEPARRILAKSRDPEITENARRVEANSRSLLGLVNQLLDMAKIESGRMGADLRQGDFTGHMREVFHSFLPLAEQRGLQLSLHLGGNITPFLYDPGKVEVVLNNLLSNALKFTPEGGQVSVSCIRAAAPGRPAVEIAVSDTGIGIPAEALSKVFNRFYQVDSSSTRPGGGTGIGLALSRELAELMGGSLTVQSEPGRGTTFTFLLPMLADALEVVPAPPGAVFDAATDAAPAGTALPTPRAAAEQPTVLLVEDNAELRAFVRACLTHAWQVVEASNGEEGLEKARELLPDLVISDVMMPRKDGYALCEELKTDELTAHIPVILLTSKATLDAKLRGLRNGADDYLTKPFNSDELLARMENLVIIRRRLRQRFGQAAQSPTATGLGETAEPEFLTPPDREWLRRFTLTVEQHLPDESVGVEDLARKMLVSRVQLHRKLKAITDQNVTDFVRDYRLNRAMSMLKNGEGRVYEVASKVGFGSEKYFSRAFKEKFGISPSQVR